MIVAITGGTGFIGSKLVLRCLSLGYEVRVLSRQIRNGSMFPANVQWYCGDLTETSILHSFLDDVDVLFHCAGQVTAPEKMRGLHVDGTKHLMDAALGRVGHWVQLSSVGVYGPVSTGIITEHSPINPIGEYEVTKALSDEMVIAAGNQGVLSCTVLRPSNVFGADMKNKSLLGMIKMIDRGLFFFIGQPGASANYIHVDNVVEALVRCGTMTEARGGVYNLSDYSTMEEFVQFISTALGRRMPRLRIPETPIRWLGKRMETMSGFPLTQERINALTNRSVYSTDRIQEDLAYSNVISQHEGLREMVAAYPCAA